MQSSVRDLGSVELWQASASRALRRRETYRRKRQLRRMSVPGSTSTQPEGAACASPSAHLPDGDLDPARGHARAIAQAGAVVGAVTLFVLAGWFTEPVREVLGRIGLSVPALVYAGVLVLVAVRIVVRSRPDLLARLRPLGRLSAPAGLAGRTSGVVAARSGPETTGRVTTAAATTAGANGANDARRPVTILNRRLHPRGNRYIFTPKDFQHVRCQTCP